MAKGRELISSLLIVLLASFCHNAETQLQGHASDETCVLDSSLPFSWMIRIWSMLNEQQLAQGVLIKPHIVLSTCLPVTYVYHGTSKTQLIGQRIEKMGKNCTQTRGVARRHQHPHCTNSTDAEQILYDFMIWLAEKPFAVAGAPFLKYPDLATVKDLATSFESYPNNTKCQLAYYDNPFYNAPPLIKYQAKSIKMIAPFKKVCVPLLCETLPPDQEMIQDCIEGYSALPDLSVICSYDTRNLIELYGGYTYFSPATLDGSMGAVLFCEGTAVGLTTRVVVRTFKPEYRSFRLITTFRSSLKWIKEEVEFVDSLSKLVATNRSFTIKPLKESEDKFYDFKNKPNAVVTEWTTIAGSRSTTNNPSQFCVVVILLSFIHPWPSK